MKSNEGTSNSNRAPVQANATTLNDIDQGRQHRGNTVSNETA